MSEETKSNEHKSVCENCIFCIKREMFEYATSMEIKQQHCLYFRELLDKFTPVTKCGAYTKPTPQYKYQPKIVNTVSPISDEVYNDILKDAVKNVKKSNCLSNGHKLGEETIATSATFDQKNDEENDILKKQIEIGKLAKELQNQTKTLMECFEKLKELFKDDDEAIDILKNMKKVVENKKECSDETTTEFEKIKPKGYETVVDKSVGKDETIRLTDPTTLLKLGVD